MYQLLYKYLILYKRVCVPGLGIFFIERKPAVHDFAYTKIKGPSIFIDFKAEHVAADKRFYSFIAKETGADESRAVRQFNDFAFNLRQEVINYSSVSLPMMGTLRKDENGSIVFDVKNEINNYFPDVAAERVQRNASEHTILVGDTERTRAEMQEHYADNLAEPGSKLHWWILAIALGLIGIAAIVYYYLRYGSLR